MVQGARKREEKQWWRSAWEVAHLLNVAGKYLKHSVSPAKLLGKVLGGADS